MTIQPDKTETLDPADWEGTRKLAHQMVDDAIDYLQSLREQPVWQPVPEKVKEALSSAVPLEPQGAEVAYEEFRRYVLPYPMGNIHPRFWGWYMGNGTFLGALGDFWAAVMNPNLGGGSHAATLVEAQVIDWCKEMLVYPDVASGLLVSGASMANLVGLAVARNVKADFDVRSDGVGAAQRPLRLYSSTEVHSCHQKAVELLGLGSRALRKIPTDEAYRIDIALLQRAIQEDRQAGLQPIGVIGNAGTVNTGAVDDLASLADLCAQENLWFHVDGAIGALVTLAPTLRPMVAGIERADSVALDLHKWMHVPFEAGCVLVRNEEAHRYTFSLTPEYLQHAERGLAGGAAWFSDYGIQLSRGFRALKVWLSIKEQGARKFGRLMEQNVKQAQYLAERVNQHARLELMAPVSLNIVCFRFNSGDLDEPLLTSLNQELLMRLHESGIAVPTYTTLQGRYCLRAAIANHRTRIEDLDRLIDAVVELGGQLLTEFEALPR